MRREFVKDEQDGKAKEEFVESKILTIVVSIVKSTCETDVVVSLNFSIGSYYI